MIRVLLQPVSLCGKVFEARISGLDRASTPWQVENNVLKLSGLSSHFRYIITISGRLERCDAYVEVTDPGTAERLAEHPYFRRPGLYQVEYNPVVECSAEITKFDRHVPGIDAYAYDILVRYANRVHHGQIQVPLNLHRQQLVPVDSIATYPDDSPAIEHREGERKRKRDVDLNDNDPDDGDQKVAKRQASRSFVWSGKAATPSRVRECVVCSESKAEAEFPPDFGHGHDHQSTLCFECYQTHLLTQLEAVHIDEIGCADCPAPLGVQLLRVVATSRTLQI